MIPPDDAVREAARKLAHAVSEYRLAHDTRGGASLAAGRAWDEMRRAEQAVYAALAGVAGGGAAYVVLCKRHEGTEIIPGPYCPYCTAEKLMDDGRRMERDHQAARARLAAPLDAQDHGGKVESGNNNNAGGSDA